MEENPRLRALEMIPVRQGGREMILLRDPEGIMEKPLLISRELAYVLLLMDGTRSLRDIQVEYMRAFGELIYGEKLAEVVSTLDEYYLLINLRYENYLAKLRDAYEKETLRPPAWAGKSYPLKQEELLSFLGELFAPTESRRIPSVNIHGLLSPHIDYIRGKEVYREVYPFLKDKKGCLFVIFGTSHLPLGRLWAISLKDFATPLGRVHVPEELKEIVFSSPLNAYVDEWPHRREHSIELQLPLIQYMLGEDFFILPILAGGMDAFVSGERREGDSEIEELLGLLKACLLKYGRPFIVLSGADFAHIGIEFGDPYPAEGWRLDSSRRRDEMLLGFVERCDAEGFLGLVREEKNCRRICGLSSIYFQLKLMGGMRGEVVAYKQWADGGSSVSFAGAVFYSKKER